MYLYSLFALRACPLPAFASWASEMPKGLQIIAIPCNQFGKQEPGTAAEIKAFVFGQVANPRDLKLTRDLQGKTNFTLLEKSDVNGPNTHPIFKLAKDKFAGIDCGIPKFPCPWLMCAPKPA